uniref:Olfactory receptor n=1 Tax=Geotrypetes seraphini TaxID=260995 RepID=A0A6P8PWM9_GEOSA|nr:olfactory receptor 8D4-like [Geotrypetes seraphini]
MKDPLMKTNNKENEFIEMVNHSSVTEFLLLGFSEFEELQLPLFILFSLLYLMAVLGNLFVICIVCADRHLHTPMYFFLANLSLLDIFSMTVTLPKLLAILLTHNHTISFSVCIIQMYGYMGCTETEYLLLTAMAYDRYVAICNPLRYTIIMNTKVCALLAAASLITGSLDVLPHIITVSQFSFCDSNVIDHFFCEITALLKLSCTDTSIIQTMTFVMSAFTAFAPFLLTLTSYLFIISSILKIRSREGKSKAFSTCSSHLTVIVLSYGTIMGVYLQPESGDSVKSNKLPTAVTLKAKKQNNAVYNNKSLKRRKSGVVISPEKNNAKCSDCDYGKQYQIVSVMMLMLHCDSNSRNANLEIVLRLWDYVDKKLHITQQL